MYVFFGDPPLNAVVFMHFILGVRQLFKNLHSWGERLAWYLTHL